MNWLVYCFLTIFLYGIHDIILKQLSDSMNATVSGIIINLSAFVCLLIYYLGRSAYKSQSMICKISSANLLLLSIAGACLGIATITFMKAFMSGGNFSIVLPIVYIGIILLSACVGFIIFHEQLNLRQLLGITLSVVGLLLLFKK